MKINSVFLSFGASDFTKVRRDIFLGYPVGPYGQNGLVQVPEDVFVVQHYPDDAEIAQMRAESEYHSDVQQEFCQRLDNCGGKVGLLWQKIKTKSPNTAKALKGLGVWFGVDSILDIGNTIRGKAGDISHSINDKIASAMDEINKKIQDFSFKKIDEAAEEISEKIQEIDSGSRHAAHTNDEIHSEYGRDVDHIAHTGTETEFSEHIASHTDDTEISSEPYDTDPSAIDGALADGSDSFTIDDTFSV